MRTVFCWWDISTLCLKKLFHYFYLNFFKLNQLLLINDILYNLIFSLAHFYFSQVIFDWGKRPYCRSYQLIETNEDKRNFLLCNFPIFFHLSDEESIDEIR